MPFDAALAPARLTRSEVLAGEARHRRDDPVAGVAPTGDAARRPGHPDVVARAAGYEDGLDEHRTLERAAAHALDRLCAVEQAKARLDAAALETSAWLHTVLGQLFEDRLHRSPGVTRVPIGLDRVVAKEIALATGLSEIEVSRRLEVALHPRRHRVVLERLRAGEVALSRVLHLAEASAHLDDEWIPALEEKVLAPPNGSRRPPAQAEGAARHGGGNAADEDEWSRTFPVQPDVVPAATFRQRLRRAVTAADPEGTGRRRTRAVRNRSAWGRITEDGAGVLSVTGAAERIVAALDRADAAARAARRAGDERTLDQLRSDFVTDAVLTWWPDASPVEERPVTSDVTTGVTTGEAAQPSFAGAGRPVPASVWIVVPFEVAAGVSEAPCELPGHGWVTAAHAREIITAEGSVWRDVAADVDTGRVIGLASSGYVPSRELAEFVRARDGVCRGPGCGVAAATCDLDHRQPAPEGPTAEHNLVAASRRCHNAKTAGLWHSERVADHGLRWTTLGGREYVTYPKNWREALQDEAGHGRGNVGEEAPPF